MAEFTITYEDLTYVAVFVACCCVGLIAAIVFVLVECVCLRPRLRGGAVVGWALALFFVFAAAGTAVAAVAVYQFPVAAGVLLVFFFLLAVLWALLYGTSNAFRDGGAGHAGGERNKTAERSARGCLAIGGVRPGAFVACVVLAIVFALTCVWLRDLCVAFYPTSVSVWLSRYSLPPAERCEQNNGAPCHVFFTLSATPDEMIVNFHHRVPSIDSARVAYARWSDDDAGGTSAQAQGLVYQYEDIPYNTAREYRAVSWVYLRPLAPGRSISVQVSLGGVWSAPYRVRTLPATDAGLRFVAGGDSGVLDAAQSLYRVAAATEPHFAMHGGDIAYGNGMVNCVSRWDLWLHQWETLMRTPAGYAVPLVAAVGNHESGGFTLGEARSSFFKYFVQEPNVTDTRARNTYHAHVITATTTVLVLDSAIMLPHEAQVPWLSGQLAHTAAPNKWAVYHVPLYPSATDPAMSQSADGRRLWGPLFDAYGLQIGFEHHDHSYKRSKKIRNGTVVDDPSVAAPVYLGDGCWGVDPIQPNPDPNGYFVRTAAAAHVYVGARSPNNTAWLFRALLPDGSALDEFEVR